VDHILGQRPSFITLPAVLPYYRWAPVDNESMSAFFTREVFLRDYEHLFDLTHRLDYVLAVYKHRQIDLAPEALAAGAQLAAQSQVGAH
jgi:hypothetical protein